MSKRNWELFIFDIIESIEKIEKYIKNLSYEKFISDEKTKDAIVRNLELIGEASNQIPKEIQHRYNEIKWSQIIGLRHRLIHDYFIIDYNLVWYIVKNELSELKEKITKIIKNNRGST